MTEVSLFQGHQANKHHVAVPWGAIAHDPEFFINSDDLPENVKIVELSKMRSEHLLSCYHKWLKLQNSNQHSFRFKAVAPHHVRMPAGKGKKGSPQKPVETSDGVDSNRPGADEDNAVTSDSVTKPGMSPTWYLVSNNHTEISDASQAGERPPVNKPMTSDRSK